MIPECVHRSYPWQAECVNCRRARHAVQREWFDRTRHCGQCGNPGTYCTCRTPCGCADRHENGSGLRDDALDAFAEPSPVEVSADQCDLFGEAL